MKLTVFLLVILAIGANAAATKVAKTQEKDIITDLLGLFDWAIGLLETFGFNIMDILGQFLPAELMDILQLLQDIGILPIAKRSIIDDLMAAINMIMEMGLAAFEQLAELLPPEILSILEMLFQIGAFPKTAVQQSIDEWLMALMDTLFALMGEAALDMLIQMAADLGIPAELVQSLWEMVIGGFPVSSSHAIRVDIIDWAIQMLQELGLQALAILGEFLPAEILSILEMLLQIGAFPVKHVAKQSIDEWLMALIDTFFQLFGDAALDMLIQMAGDLGIDAALIQSLWDMIIGGFPVSSSHAIRVDIIDWAIQMLLELGLQALAFLSEFLPPEIMSLLIDLVLGGLFPAKL